MFQALAELAMTSRVKLSRHIAVLLILAVALLGCGPTPDRYKGYEGPTRQAAEVAILRGKSASIWGIDGMRFKHPDPQKYYSEAHLPPGNYYVTAYCWFGVSVLIVPRGYVEATRSFSLNMEAGHIYELHADRTTGPGFRLYFWVEDATTGFVVAGQKLS